MTQHKTTSTIASIYQNKCLIINDIFVTLRGGYCLAFHRRARSARLYINLKTLTDMHGAYGGVFL